HIDNAAGDHVAVFMFGDVFVERRRDELLHAEAETPLRGIDLQHLRLHHLPNLEYILRMIQALVGRNIADMNHAFDALGNLYERAELLYAGDRTFHHTAHG